MAPYTLYTWGTPNGWKASIIMEELGLEYDVKEIDISTNAQKEDWFLKINPNGRIPAIVDHTNNDLAVFETGAIMWYLVMKEDKERKFWPEDFNKRAEVMSWLMFQMGGVGPMQGQANHFVRYAKPQLPYAMHRYTDETKRLYEVLDGQLASHDWLAADQYTIADMANFAWVAISGWSGVDYRQFPNLAKWVKRINSRPAVKKGIRIPNESPLSRHLDDEALYDEKVKEAAEKIKQAEAAQ